jgi:hypothetical protein
MGNTFGWRWDMCLGSYVKSFYNYHERYGKTHVFFPLYTFWGLRFTFRRPWFFQKSSYVKPTVQTKNFGIIHNSLFVGILSSRIYTCSCYQSIWQTLIISLLYHFLLLSYIFADSTVILLLPSLNAIDSLNGLRWWTKKRVQVRLKVYW